MLPIVVVACFAAAAVPDVIVLSGHLVRDGENVDGTVAAEFSIFDAASDGTAIASVTVAPLEVIDGVFVAELAGVIDDVAAADAVFVEVAVDGETLQPRLRIGTVPFAAKAGAVDFADITGVPADLLDGDDVTVTNADLTIASPFGLSGRTLVVLNNAVQGDSLADGAVRSEKLLAGAVTSSKIANDAVLAQHIASNAVGTDELQNNSINSIKYQANSVPRGALQGGDVGSAEVDDNSLTQSDLATNAVGTAEIADNAISAQKMQTDSITRAQLQGTELDVFVVDNPNCEGFALMTLNAVCRSRACAVVAGALTFSDCIGTCNQPAPLFCAVTQNRIGRLLSGQMQ